MTYPNTMTKNGGNVAQTPVPCIASALPPSAKTRAMKKLTPNPASAISERPTPATVRPIMMINTQDQRAPQQTDVTNRADIDQDQDDDPRKRLCCETFKSVTLASGSQSGDDCQRRYDVRARNHRHAMTQPALQQRAQPYGQNDG